MRFLREMNEPGFPSTVILVGAVLVVCSVLLPMTLRFFAVAAGLVILLGAMLVALDAVRTNDVRSSERGAGLVLGTDREAADREAADREAGPRDPEVFAELDRVLQDP